MYMIHANMHESDCQCCYPMLDNKPSFAILFIGKTEKSGMVLRQGNCGGFSMAGKAIWKGFINFGDVNLPVKLHTAIREERIQFHLLHRRDRVKLRQQMICAYEDEPVPVEAQVKGFEVEDGKYVIVDPAELEQADPESSRLVEVHEFVKTGQIDTIFLERVYCLEPDINIKGYNTLVRALKEMDVAGICTWAMRKRSYLGALQASGKILRLTTLRHADEVIAAKSLELEKIPLSEKELKIGAELINQLTVPFQPHKFENEHQKKLQMLIDKKARGEKVAVLRPRQLKPTASDKLLQALEASLKRVA
ncbi:MAG: Ku protein [Thermodesulfovibrio sp.]|nr:Ku protein [Thermodesulfovibrio sp.]